MKTALILTGDYWHPTDTITPIIGHMLPTDKWNVAITEDPSNFITLQKSPDLLITFKDPIENNQIPTPTWCDETWSGILKRRVNEDGMGFLAIHCGLADFPKEHMVSQEILGAYFVTHPPQCEVRFVPEKAHSITANVAEFTFPAPDEHYVMEMIPGFPTEILGYTVSRYGRQPALWTHESGNGKICAVTPGHVTENLLCGEYLKLLQNAAKWCVC